MTPPVLAFVGPVPGQPIELTIVMPCLNEAATLATCIRKARGFLESAAIDGEIVIGDNGSTDGSQDIARRHGARVVPVAQRGYGAALYVACLSARGRYIIMGDCDDSYDFSNLAPFLEKLRAGYDLVMGNRFRGGIRPGAMPWKNRYFGNPVLSRIGRLFFHCPARDFNCGLRAFSRAAFHKMDLCTTGMEFASEMVIKATLLGMKVCEVPTTLSPDGRSRPPHLRPWRDGWRNLRFMLLYSPRWLFWYPGLLLMAVGIGAGAWLMPHIRYVGGVGFDVSTLLYASLAVLMGYQAAIFAVFTKVFGVAQGLLPPDRSLNELFRRITLESGLVAGALLFLGGLAGSIYSVWHWRQQGFGPLNAAAMLRIVIPSATALALGCQTVLASFFLSVLGLKTHDWRIHELTPPTLASAAGDQILPLRASA